MLKRFINADSALEAVLTNGCVNFMQYNLYAYCNDNPVNKTYEMGYLSLFNEDLFREYIGDVYTEWTGLTKEEHLSRNKYNIHPEIDEVCWRDKEGNSYPKGEWIKAEPGANQFHTLVNDNQIINGIEEYKFNEKFLYKNSDGSS